MRIEVRNGRECTLYERRSEVSSIAPDPPWYCDVDGNELVYYSFFDIKGRCTLRARCPKCKKDWAIAVNNDKYEERMLKHWSDMVKERAMYKCEMADGKCKGPLHAHHMIPKHLDPDKKYAVENGMCLCEAHHKMIHSYM